MSLLETPWRLRDDRWATSTGRSTCKGFPLKKNLPHLLRSGWLGLGLGAGFVLLVFSFDWQ